MFDNNIIAKGCVREIHRLAKSLAKNKRKIRFMHVCGTHEYTITSAGIRSQLPSNVEVVCGPGCPVCVTTAREIEEALYLAKQGVIITTFGDLFKVPGSHKNGVHSLAEGKAAGYDIRVVYSIADAVSIAEKTKKEVVHIAVGFETTAPSTAAVIRETPPENFSILSCHRLIPPAMEALLTLNVSLDGFINPGHVSTIIGVLPYKKLGKYGIPQVISGFEPTDVLKSILLLLQMLRDGKSEVKNEYVRVVKEEGNQKALRIMREVFNEVDREWRGLPVISKSGLELKNEYLKYDARKKFSVDVKVKDELPKGCSCADVLIGKIYPHQCPLFNKLCTPENPVGPCAVSSEGACYVAMRYHPKKQTEKV